MDASCSEFVFFSVAPSNVPPVTHDFGPVFGYVLFEYAERVGIGLRLHGIHLDHVLAFTACRRVIEERDDRRFHNIDLAGELGRKLLGNRVVVVESDNHSRVGEPLAEDAPVIVCLHDSYHGSGNGLKKSHAEILIRLGSEEEYVVVFVHIDDIHILVGSEPEGPVLQIDVSHGIILPRIGFGVYAEYDHAVELAQAACPLELIEPLCANDQFGKPNIFLADEPFVDLRAQEGGRLNRKGVHRIDVGQIGIVDGPVDSLAPPLRGIFDVVVVEKVSGYQVGDSHFLRHGERVHLRLVEPLRRGRMEFFSHRGEVVRIID